MTPLGVDPLQFPYVTLIWTVLVALVVVCRVARRKVNLQVLTGSREQNSAQPEAYRSAIPVTVTC